MEIVLALIAALGFGVSDFIALSLTKGIGTYRTLLYIQLPGLIGLSIYWLVFGTPIALMRATSWLSWGWAGMFVLLSLLSALAFYRALEVGAASIVSPIVACYAVVAVLLSVLTGEVLSQNHTLGIIDALAGVALTVTSFSKTGTQQNSQLRLSVGIGYALAAALGYGLTFWVVGKLVIPQMGTVAPIWLMRLITPCILTALARPLRQQLRLPNGTIWWLIAAVGFFDTLGYICSGRALENGYQIALVGVLTSLYSAVTVVLAGIFFRERLQWSQWLGVGIIFVGVVLLNF